MRVSGEGSAAEGVCRSRGGFGEALSRARSADADRGSAGAAAKARSSAPAPSGRAARGRAGRLASPVAFAPPPESGRLDVGPDPSPVAELAALARALPPAIAAARTADGPLALSFGRSLDVELRSTGAGVELLLRPDATLARAAEAELPRMIAALKVRGVAVARAEVRPRPGGGGRAR